MEKYLDLEGLTSYDKKIKAWFKSSVVDITDDEIQALFPVVQPNNEIWYTSSDGNVVNLVDAGGFIVNVVSNTYENGKGVITFDGEVTRIGDAAFPDCSSLTTITIPNSVTHIGTIAFSNSGLTSIAIPNSVTSVDNEAFYKCSGLTSINIPDSVTVLGYNIFVGCSSLPTENNLRYADTYLVEAVDKTLSIYSIKEGTKWIGEAVFDKCSALTSITIPNSVMSIGQMAFASCSSLTSITYTGTQDQWNTITKGGGWNSLVPATHVQCTDGQVTL